MQYPAHESFVAPARARPQIWRLLAGFVLILAVYAACIAVVFAGLVAVSGFDGAQGWMARMGGEGTPNSTLLVLATFIGMGLGPLLAARLLHKRGWLTPFGALRRGVRDFGIAAAICGGLYMILQMLPADIAVGQNLEFGLWLSFLPLAILGILIQTGAEEVLFRGYLQQQLAARFSSPIVWMVLPSVLFALAHYQPALMGDNAWLVVLAVGLFAILAADLTAVTGSIGAAWGFHFSNNAVAILFLSLEGPLSGLALFTVTADPADTALLRPLLFQDMAVTVVTWGLIRYAVTRRR